jgi:transposase
MTRKKKEVKDGRERAFELLGKEKRSVRRFMRTTNEKEEYQRGMALLLRSKGGRVKDVARELGVCEGVIYKWEALFRNDDGVEGLRSGKPTGRPPTKGEAAKKLIPGLMKKEPKLFGYLKGRWVVRDIASELKKEGVEIGKSQVRQILEELNLSFKRPKLTVKSNDSQYWRKAREVANYKRIAPALAKKG